MHADRSAQNAVVLSMMACRMTGKFRAPEREMGRSMVGQISRPAIAVGRLGSWSAHALHPGGMGRRFCGPFRGQIGHFQPIPAIVLPETAFKL